jgi:phosphate/sulfate permease
MHEPVNYDYFWIFVITAILLAGGLMIISPKIMEFLDKIADKLSPKEKDSDKNRRE